MPTTVAPHFKEGPIKFRTTVHAIVTPCKHRLHNVAKATYGTRVCSGVILTPAPSAQLLPCVNSVRTIPLMLSDAQR